MVGNSSRIILSLLLISFFSCSKEAEEFAFRSELSVVLPYTVVKVDGGKKHLAFPTITGNPDLSKILLAYREGDSHASFDGVLVQQESDDYGKSWKNRRIIYTPAYGHDARDPQLLMLPDGSILCRFFERSQLPDGQVKSEVKCYVSKDGGQTYSYLSTLPNISNSTLAAARGNMLLLENEIYTVCYNLWSNSWLLKSSDWGQSWELVTSLDPSINAYFNAARINEVSLGYSNGKMCLVGRQSDQSDKKTLYGTSEDFGKNWTWTKLSEHGEAPSITCIEDSFIMTYRDVSKSTGYEFKVALLKENNLVSAPIKIVASQTFDIGYGDVLLLANSFLVCYYTHEGIFCSEFKYDLLLPEKKL